MDWEEFSHDSKLKNRAQKGSYNLAKGLCLPGYRDPQFEKHIWLVETLA
jgi:hypothetical protein